MEKRFYTPRQAAELLSVSPDTVLRLIQRGELPAVRVSERIYRIPIPAFERFQSGTPVMRRRVTVVQSDMPIDIAPGERLPELEHA